MNSRQRISQAFLTLAKNKQGNFAVMTAICLPALLGIGGAAFEIARAMQVKADLQSVADSAVLSATTKARIQEGKMTEAQMVAAANSYIAASSFANELPEEDREDLFAGIQLGASKQKTDKGEEFNVTSVINYNMRLNPLLSFIGHDSLRISVESNAKSTFNKGAAISLYMLLDRSTSMSYATETPGTNKISALKVAVNYLVDTLNTSDPTFSSAASQQSKLMRTGAISYNHQADKESPMSWGTKASLKYSQDLKSPDGYTSAVDAMKAAIKALEKSNPKESQEHQSQGNSSFSRYIVFMTDGEMTGNNAKWSSSIDSTVRTLCASAKADGITIFSVAFMAPSKGQDLLKNCATSQSHYFAPEKMSELVAAFGAIARQASSKVSVLTH